MNKNESQFPKEKKCIYCGKSILCKNKTVYNRTKYCSRQCVNNCPIHKELVRKKLIEAYKSSPAKQEQAKKLAKAGAEYAKKRSVERMNKNVKLRDGWKNTWQELDITYRELEEYRKIHLVCDICGRKEITDTSGLGKPNKLSIDHNHNTKSFRGLLCQSCNRMLGWYENQRKNIERYLYLHDPEWRNGKRS